MEHMKQLIGNLMHMHEWTLDEIHPIERLL